MELYDAIKGRRSVRRYTTDTIPDDVLGRVVEAAQWAPTWAHTQCPELVLVDDPALKDGVIAALPEKNPAYKALGQAPVIAVFCGRKGRAGFKKGEAATPRGDWLMFDVALAMQNFMLAAHAEGLATVCVGLFDSEAVRAALKLPDDYDVVTLTPLGYPDQEPNLPPRKPVEEFAHKNKL